MKRSIFWRVAAAIFAIVNFGGAVFAAATGEWMHGAVHVGLLLVGYFVWQLSWGRRQDLPVAQETLAAPTAESLEYLQQSVDAVALEVERIGEAQRFSEKLRAESPQKAPPDKPGPR
jgi:cytochrome b